MLTVQITSPARSSAPARKSKDKLAADTGGAALLVATAVLAFAF
jgi:hypothetical protein